MEPAEGQTKLPENIPASKNPFSGVRFRDFIYLAHILGQKERALLGFALVLALISGTTAAGLFFFTHTNESPRTGGVIREGLLRPPERINPLFLSNNDTDRDISMLLFSRLFTYDADGALQPEIAESYSISEDGRSYSVSLKKDVKWHDGEPLTADDVVFTVKSIQDPLYKSSIRPNWQGVTIERLGDYEVRFVLRQPYSPFLQNLALAVIPEHIWKKIPPDSASLAELNAKPIGSGPYMAGEFERDSNGVITRYTVNANPSFFLEGPYIKTVEFSFFDSEQNLLQAFRAGLIDSVGTVSARNADTFKKAGASVFAIRIPRVFAVFLNESNAALKDKTTRQALALAIPRDELISDVLGGGAIKIDSPIPPGSFGFNPDIVPTPFDIELAKSLLEKSGWKDLDGDGLREKKAAKKGASSTPLKLTLATSDWNDLASSVEAIRGYWRNIGVETELKILPINELEADIIRPRAYDSLLFGEILGRDPDPFAFWHSSQLKDPGLNIALYHSKKVDTLMEDARRANDRADVEAKYREFQKILDQDFPSIFLYSPTHFFAARTNIRGINLKSLGIPADRFSLMRLWYIKTKRIF